MTVLSDPSLQPIAIWVIGFICGYAIASIPAIARFLTSNRTDV